MIKSRYGTDLFRHVIGIHFGTRHRKTCPRWRRHHRLEESRKPKLRKRFSSPHIRGSWSPLIYSCRCLYRNFWSGNSLATRLAAIRIYFAIRCSLLGVISSSILTKTSTDGIRKGWMYITPATTMLIVHRSVFLLHSF